MSIKKDAKQLNVELHNFIVKQSKFNQGLADAMDMVWKKLFPDGNIDDAGAKDGEHD